MKTGELWAITSYFNPRRYRRRLANYRMFRKHLDVPLATVELSFGATFELKDGDADILVQVRDGDIMFQKERLLNIACAALPPECRKVVWLDCDLVIGRADWAERVCASLDKLLVVQPFSDVYHLSADVAESELRHPGIATFRQDSLARGVCHGQSFHDALERSRERVAGSCAAGFAWASRREFLQTHGLYDKCIIGGGDTAFAAAVFGCLEETVCRHHLNDWQREAYYSWAKDVHAAAVGSVGLVDCPIFHLWHGDLGLRRGWERHRNLAPFDFNPDRDLARTGNSPWRWNSDKPLLHQHLVHYFASRQEDG